MVDRDQVARYVHRSIAELARGAAWSTASRTEDGDTLAQGDYTDAIDSALRELGYLDELTGLPDETLVDASDFDVLAGAVRQAALERLAAYYATVVDTVGGPVRIYRSQVAQALARLGLATSGRVVMSRGLSTNLVRSLLQDD
jgi:hypothetical protein